MHREKFSLVHFRFHLLGIKTFLMKASFHDMTIRIKVNRNNVSGFYSFLGMKICWEYNGNNNLYCGWEKDTV